jgi:DNA polymerase-3 subunit delta
VKVEELRRELSKGKFRPAYLLLGVEPLLRDDAFAAIRGAVLAAGEDAFNLDRLSGESTTPAALRNAVDSLPVLAQRRLVLLREPDAGRGAAKALTQALAEIVGEVAAQSETVLVVSAAKADRRSRWVKAFKQPMAVVDCDPPRAGRALIGFIEKEAREQQLELGPGAAQALGERVGPQLLVLRQELAKAALLAGPGEKVGRGHIEESASQIAEAPIWDLTDAIGEGRTARAIDLLGRILSAGAPPPVVLGSLANHFRRLARTRAGQAPGGPPFVVRKLDSQSRRYTAARLLACLRAIHAADTDLKGASSLRPSLTLERLVLGLSA